MSRDAQVVSGFFCSSQGCVQVASEGSGSVNARSVSHQGPGLLAVHITHVELALVLLSTGT